MPAAAPTTRWRGAGSGPSACGRTRGWTRPAPPAAAASDDERVAARVMQRYEERLAAYQAVDFDDLIGLPLKLLQRDAEARAKWQAQFRHVLVDEYQDTNAVQYELLKALVEHRTTPHGLFTAVGDDDQSIYGWRGATIDNLQAPAAGLPAAEGDRAGAELPLHRPHPARGQPRDREQPEDLREEAVERVRRRRAGARGRVRRRGARGRARGGAHPGAARRRAAQVKFSDFAILYRANHQARVFEQKLRAAQIPYKVSGGQSFFDRAEIKDLCAWLRLLVNQDDDPAFLRAVTTPKRGIGHQTLASAGRVCRQVEDEPVRGAVLAQPGQRAEGQGDRARCTSSAARSTTWSTAPATPPAPRTPRRCCSAG